jgi:hypothetical protein
MFAEWMISMRPSPSLSATVVRPYTFVNGGDVHTRALGKVAPSGLS